MPAKILKCAVYTRKSTDHGLELEFTSLDAQREACEAFIKSQVAEGWKLVQRRYDDAAFSGGSLERPALQALLQDIDKGLVDVIVVYKIDRLTRSLADFAKLVEVFDKKSISFVAVTQQFNTTTSMGRLTLNVLLSFAQFERELSSERVRDKIAASRQKGKWTGGSVPLGYDSRDKKLVINKAEAKIVQMIFDRYLVLKSFQKVIDELNENKVVSKVRYGKGQRLGGVPFTYGPLAYLLKNRTYLGETGHKNSWFPGEHEAIIENATFDQVQDLLRTNSEGRTGKRKCNGALLTGLLFDDKGSRMSPSFTVKQGIRYSFYVSSALLKGRKSMAGSTRRISATIVEGAVIEGLRNKLPDCRSKTALEMQGVIRQNVSYIALDKNEMEIRLTSDVDKVPPAFRLPLRMPERPKDIGELPCTTSTPDPKLVQAFVRAHVWLKALSNGLYESVEALAESIGLHPKVVRQGIKLAFLEPKLARALLEGNQAPRLNLKKLLDSMPFSWTKMVRLGEAAEVCDINRR